MTTRQQLYVSFWDVCLANFVNGEFAKCKLGATEARAMIAAAREAGGLRCVTAADLLAPYEQRSVRRHRELCTVLASDRFDLTVGDFIGTTCANVLQLARVGGNHGGTLLVISCAYSLSGAPKHESFDLDREIDMDIARDSIEFHLFAGR